MVGVLKDKLFCSFINNQNLVKLSLNIGQYYLERFSFLKTQNQLVELQCRVNDISFDKLQEILPPSLKTLVFNCIEGCEGTLFHEGTCLVKIIIIYLQKKLIYFIF
jgi:hypothetical protein